MLLDVPKNAPVKLSPDTTRGLYEIEDRHFLIEFSSRAQVEMVPDKDYVICWTEWWTARPDIVLAMVQPVSEIGGMYCKGIPAAWTLAGEGFRLLGNEPTEAYPFAPSPNGDAVA